MGADFERGSSTSYPLTRNLCQCLKRCSLVNRLVLYAHYDEQRQIKPYVAHMLNHLQEICRNVVFVSTSQLSDSELQKIHNICQKIYLKDNAGYDFGMWKLALKELGSSLPLYDEIILINSSVYGPIYPLTELFNYMEKVDCDFWGITESYEIDRHLQSYFLVFRNKVTQSCTFKSFWDGVLEYDNKNQTIRSYEIGLSQWLLQHEFKLGAYCSWQRLARHCRFEGGGVLRRPCNPTMALASALLKLRSPFVKLELLRSNPCSVDLHEVKRLMFDAGFPRDLIISEKGTSDGLLGAEGSRCPRCGGEGKQLYAKLGDRSVPYSPEKWSIWSCCTGNQCGAAWVRPAPSPTELTRSYQTYYTHGITHIEHHTPRHRFIIKILLSACKRLLNLLNFGKKREKFYLHGLGDGATGRLLEVGCGSGDRLVSLRSRGWEVEGQEVDPLAVQFCKEKQNLEVHYGRLEDLKLGAGAYDAILMSHVLEHVEDPVPLLRESLRLLKPGGRLLLTTPNIKGFGHLIYRKHWLALDPPRHLLIYTPTALKKILYEAGFGTVKVTTVALNHELISLHSRDIKLTTWTDFYDLPRIQNELVPVILQIIALFLNLIFPESGEECFAKAERN